MYWIFILFLFFFFFATSRHMQFQGQGSNLSCSCGNAGFFNSLCWARDRTWVLALQRLHWSCCTMVGPPNICYFKNYILGVPVKAQRKWIWLESMRMRFQFLASLSVLGIQHCHELWWSLQTCFGSPVAVAGSCSSNSTLSLGTSLCCRWGSKKQNKKKKKKKEKKRIIF